MSRPFRILSLDGGGLMGAFSASVLNTLESDCKARTGRGLVEHFDLIAGTSTGGIIAIALAMGIDAAKVLDFYANRGAGIFPPRSGLAGWVRTVGSFFRPKHSPGELRKAVGEVVGETTLKEARTRLVIPTYDAQMGRIFLFKTPHHRDCTYARDVKAVDAALATSAAPTYFPAHHVPGFGKFIDGGIWGNCPAAIGIVEAVSYCEQDLKDVRVLSISTTSYPSKIDQKCHLGGLARWAPRIIGTLMYSQAQAAIGQAIGLLRDRSGQEIADRFRRIDYTAEAGLKLDDSVAVPKLIEIGSQVAREVKTAEMVRREFLNGEPVLPFVPV